MADASTFPTAAEADAALAAAQAALASAEAEYEAELELALNTCVAEWQALRSNTGKSPSALIALLRAIAETGELPECDNGALSVFMEKFLDRRESLAAVRAEAKSAYDVSLARHKAQALQRSRALRARELAQLQAVYPEYARVEGEDPQVQVDRLAGLLEHTVIAQRLLERVDGLALGMEQLGARMVSLEAAAATAKAAAARPAWAARMRRADADLLLAAHAGDFDAAEAALADGAAVNCANQARGATKCARSIADRLFTDSSRRRRCTWLRLCAMISRPSSAATWRLPSCSSPRAAIRRSMIMCAVHASPILFVVS